MSNATNMPTFDPAMREVGDEIAAAAAESAPMFASFLCN
jgi:hypothetical protein